MGREQRLLRCDHENCNATFHGRWRLNKHRQTHNKPHVCSFDGCSKAFGNRRNLLIHERIHRKERCEKCNFCDKSFTDPSTLRYHIKTVHNNGDSTKPFVCRQCHKGFNKRTFLQNHLLTHLPKNDRNLFDCTHCNASFATKSNLNRHVKRLHPP